MSSFFDGLFGFVGRLAAALFIILLWLAGVKVVWELFKWVTGAW